jgi:MFS family permease
VTERRRLPVIQNAPSASPEPAAPQGEETPRPPWHWVGFGTVAIFAGWLPLAYVAGAVSARVMAARFGKDASREQVEIAVAAMEASEKARLMATIALPNVLALALAAFGGGVIVGRFGTGTGTREAALSGAVAAIVASIMAWAGPSVSSLVAAAVTFAVAIGFAAWGGRLGASRRPSEAR